MNNTMEDGIASPAAAAEHFDDFGIYHASKLLEDDIGNYLDDDFDCDISFGFPQKRQRRRRRTTSKILDGFLEFTKERDLSTKSFNDGIDLKIPFTDDDNSIMDIYKSADSFLNPSEYSLDADQLSYEESGHQEIPQNDDASIPNQNQFCPKCGGMNQRFIDDDTLKCFNAECDGTNHEIKTEYDDLESIFNNDMIEIDPNINNRKKPKKTKKMNKVDIAKNDDSVENGSGGIKKSRRRQSNKAEITPPVQSNGFRLCTFCDREVRPQLCSGNKHRWRCVNKECRRWYGWVQIGEEIPKNLGKKGRFKNLTLKIHENTENGKLVPSSDNTTVRKQDAEEQINVKKDIKQQQKKIPGKRSLSPLTDEQINYVPTQLELRSRWWRSDRKRTEPSPDRQFIPSNLNVSAVSRIAEQSFRATAILTKSMISSSNQQVADDGTMCGFADLMLDSVLGIVGPLLSLTSNIPLMNNNPDLQKKLFNNFEHLPVINP